MKLQHNLSFIALAVIAATGTAQAEAGASTNQAQQGNTQQNSVQQEQNDQIRTITEWNYDELYQESGITDLTQQQWTLV
ncbi:hypothetical protein R5M92_13675 [Halomonas sp. Bachu 37]|uniref:hypothetical protein n=1 Tax=Halomonas kashgarensis TaxID=3084920 RepID=UPI003216C4A7